MAANPRECNLLHNYGVAPIPKFPREELEGGIYDGVGMGEFRIETSSTLT